jgi:hypothetical protein
MGELVGAYADTPRTEREKTGAKNKHHVGTVATYRTTHDAPKASAVMRIRVSQRKANAYPIAMGNG